MNINTSNAVEAAKEVRGRCGDAGPSSVRRSGAVVKLAFALAKAQGEMKNPPKDSVNPHFRSKYADLATVRDTVMPVLNRHGLSVLQLPCECDALPALTTILMHESGEWVETTMLLRPSKMDPQGVGSALTYARRYSLQSIAGVAADEDDDGNAASRPQPAAKPQPRPMPSSDIADDCGHAIGKAASREELTAIYRQFSADCEAGKFDEKDRVALVAAFKAAGNKFPAPAKA